MKILAIGAHDDDVPTGCGGLVLRLAKAGHEVIAVITVPFKVGRMIGDRSEGAVRREEALLSHELMGVKPLFLSHGIGAISFDPATRKEFDTLYKTVAPDVVIAHWAVDYHPDHMASGCLAYGPCLQSGVNTELLCMEVRSASGRPQCLGFVPTHYAPIRDMNEKEKVIRCHKSQDPEAIMRTHLPMWEERGRECGVSYAESYVRLTRKGGLHPELAEFFCLRQADS